MGKEASVNRKVDFLLVFALPRNGFSSPLSLAHTVSLYLGRGADGALL